MQDKSKQEKPKEKPNSKLNTKSAKVRADEVVVKKKRPPKLTDIKGVSGDTGSLTTTNVTSNNNLTPDMTNTTTSFNSPRLNTRSLATNHNFSTTRQYGKTYRIEKVEVTPKSKPRFNQGKTKIKSMSSNGVINVTDISKYNSLDNVSKLKMKKLIQKKFTKEFNKQIYDTKNKNAYTQTNDGVLQNGSGLQSTLKVAKTTVNSVSSALQTTNDKGEDVSLKSTKKVIYTSVGALSFRRKVKKISLQRKEKKLKIKTSNQKLRFKKNDIKEVKKTSNKQIQKTFVKEFNKQIFHSATADGGEREDVGLRATKKVARTTHNTYKFIKNYKLIATKVIKVIRAIIGAILKNPYVAAIAIGVSIFIIIICCVVGFFLMFLSGGTQGLASTTYTSEDEDLLQVESNYQDLELELQTEIDNVETNYPDYDEYIYILDDIYHNPYELASLLTALYFEYTPDDVAEELLRIFELQYLLEFEETIEERTRLEYVTDDEGNILTDADGNALYTEVEYEYKILTITLTSTPISEIAQAILTADQYEHYLVLLELKGNKEGLFDDIYSDDVATVSTLSLNTNTNNITSHYMITNSDFAKTLEIGKRYIGMPYVWGGSSPQTGFDCSGFISYILNESGVASFQRTTAQGLYNMSTPIPNGQQQAGDLVFFENTYATSNTVTHVGLYVGGGKMLHCGNPIGYVDIFNSAYTKNFYAFGRIE